MKKKPTYNFNVEKLEQIHKKIARDLVRDMKDKGFHLISGCRTKGVVERTILDSGICNDPKCVSCRDFERLEKEVFNE